MSRARMATCRPWAHEYEPNTDEDDCMTTHFCIKCDRPFPDLVQKMLDRTLRIQFREMQDRSVRDAYADEPLPELEP